MAKLALDEVLTSGYKKYEREILAMPIVGIEDSLAHLTLRKGIQGSLVVSQSRSGAQIRPYRSSKDATATSVIEARELVTYLGDVVEEFDIYEIYSSCFQEPLTSEGDKTKIVKALALEMSLQCSENLNEAIFLGKRNATGNTTMDLFDGYQTIIAADTTAGKISTEKGNLIALGAINEANVGDQLLKLYRSLNPALKKAKNLKMYIPTAIKEMYEDWFAANFQSAAYNTKFEKYVLHGSNGHCELVDLVGMDTSCNLIVTTKNMMLVGCDQSGTREEVKIRLADNPKMVQFFMMMFFGVQIRSIHPKYFKTATYTIE